MPKGKRKFSKPNAEGEEKKYDGSKRTKLLSDASGEGFDEFSGYIEHIEPAATLTDKLAYLHMIKKKQEAHQTNNNRKIQIPDLVLFSRFEKIGVRLYSWVSHGMALEISDRLNNALNELRALIALEDSNVNQSARFCPDNIRFNISKELILETDNKTYGVLCWIDQNVDAVEKWIEANTINKWSNYNFFYPNAAWFTQFLLPDFDGNKKAAYDFFMEQLKPLYPKYQDLGPFIRLGNSLIYYGIESYGISEARIAGLESSFNGKIKILKHSGLLVDTHHSLLKFTVPDEALIPHIEAKIQADRASPLRRDMEDDGHSQLSNFIRNLSSGDEMSDEKSSPKDESKKILSEMAHLYMVSKTKNKAREFRLIMRNVKGRLFLLTERPANLTHGFNRLTVWLGDSLGNQIRLSEVKLNNKLKSSFSAHIQTKEGVKQFYIGWIEPQIENQPETIKTVWNSILEKKEPTHDHTVVFKSADLAKTRQVLVMGAQVVRDRFKEEKAKQLIAKMRESHLNLDNVPTQDLKKTCQFTITFDPETGNFIVLSESGRRLSLINSLIELINENKDQFKFPEKIIKYFKRMAAKKNTTSIAKKEKVYTFWELPVLEPEIGNQIWERLKNKFKDRFDEEILSINSDLPENFSIEDSDSEKAPSPKAKQLGWNCFDLAVDLAIALEIKEEKEPARSIAARAALVSYALQQSGNPDYRKLLAPEICQALALTAIYIKKLDQMDQRAEQRCLVIAKAFSLDKKSLKAKEDEVEEAIRESEVDQFELKSDEKFILPKSMFSDMAQKEKILALANAYGEAHHSIDTSLSDCNNALGCQPRKSYAEMLDFFEKKENINFCPNEAAAFLEAHAYLEQSFKDLLDYASSEEIYKKYLQEYYGKEGWFAFQPQVGSTSMIDIVAKRINSQICIVYKKTILYQSKEGDINNKIFVEYNGSNHFKGYKKSKDALDVTMGHSSLLAALMATKELSHNKPDELMPPAEHKEKSQEVVSDWLPIEKAKAAPISSVKLMEVDTNESAPPAGRMAALASLEAAKEGHQPEEKESIDDTPLELKDDEEVFLIETEAEEKSYIPVLYNYNQEIACTFSATEFSDFLSDDPNRDKWQQLTSSKKTFFVANPITSIISNEYVFWVSLSEQVTLKFSISNTSFTDTYKPSFTLESFQQIIPNYDGKGPFYRVRIYECFKTDNKHEDPYGEYVEKVARNKDTSRQIIDSWGVGETFWELNRIKRGRYLSGTNNLKYFTIFADRIARAEKTFLHYYAKKNEFRLILLSLAIGFENTFYGIAGYKPVAGKDLVDNETGNKISQSPEEFAKSISELQKLPLLTLYQCLSKHLGCTNQSKEFKDKLKLLNQLFEKYFPNETTLRIQHTNSIRPQNSSTAINAAVEEKRITLGNLAKAIYDQSRKEKTGKIHPDLIDLQNILLCEALYNSKHNCDFTKRVLAPLYVLLEKTLMFERVRDPNLSTQLRM